LTLPWRVTEYGLVLLTTLCASGGPTTSGQPSPSTVSFGSIPIDTTGTQSETLTNTGRSSLAVTLAAPVGRASAFQSAFYGIDTCFWPSERAVSKDSARLRRRE